LQSNAFKIIFPNSIKLAILWYFYETRRDEKIYQPSIFSFGTPNLVTIFFCSLYSKKAQGRNLKLPNCHTTLFQNSFVSVSWPDSP
jgi:hypothetical protein